MDRYQRYNAYLMAWGTGHVADGLDSRAVAAAALGAHHHRRDVDAFTLVQVDELLSNMGVQPCEERSTQDDECDVGPSARDERIAAEAHARLSKLILAGGHVETGGRSLYEAAEDEIVRLRAELQQAKEALTQARAKVDELRNDIAYGAKRMAVEREQGAAEMRERAAVWCDRLATLEKHGIGRRALEMAAGSIRALPLSGAPGAEHGGLSAEDADALVDAGWWRDGDVWRSPHRIPLDPRNADSIAVMRAEASAVRERRARGPRLIATPADALSAEDAETLRGAGWPLRLGIWYSPAISEDYDPEIPCDLEALRSYAARHRAEKAPAPARGTPGKATGAEAAGTGKDSVAEEAPSAQGGGSETPLERAAALCRRANRPTTAKRLERGDISPRKALDNFRLYNVDRAPDADDAAAMTALEALISEPAAPSPPAALPKPERVEVGQRWRHLDDGVGRVVERLTEKNAYLAEEHAPGRPKMFTSQAGLIESSFWTFLGPAPQDPPKRDGEAEPDEARRAEVNDFAKSVISEAKRRGLISNDIMHELAGIIDRRLWPELHPITGGAYAAGWQQTEPPVFVPGPVEVHGDPTPRGAYVVGEVTRGEQAETTEPTARDAVAGMLLRAGFGTSARDVVDGARIAGVADELKSYPRNPAAVACIAALEALDRGDLCGARDHVGLAAVITRVTRERDEARACAKRLVLGQAELTRQLDEARAEAAALRGQVEEVSKAAGLLKTENERMRAEREDEHTLHDEKRRVRLTCPKDADAREVAAACVELLGLSSDEVHGGNVVEAFEAGVAEGERRAKAKAEELTEKWTRRVDRHEEQADADAARGYGAGEHRYRGRAGAVGVCVHDIRKAFGIEPNEPTTGEPAPEASEVVAGGATTAIASPPGAPDRDTLGREAHDVYRSTLRSSFAVVSWHELHDDGRDRWSVIGERLFNMGVQWARQSAPRASIPRLVPVEPGPRADLVMRVAALIQKTFDSLAAADVLSVPCAIGVLGIVDAYLQGAPVEPEAQDERWQPGAVWEYKGRALTLDGAARFATSAGPILAHFPNVAPVLVDTMTEANGWRYVGPAKAAATPDDGAYRLPALGSLTGLVGAWQNRGARFLAEESAFGRGRGQGLLDAALNLGRILQGKPPFEPSKAG